MARGRWSHRHPGPAMAHAPGKQSSMRAQPLGSGFVPAIMRSPLPLAIALLLVLTPDAFAATASVGTSTQFFAGEQAAVLYVAAPGERNRVVMAPDLATPYPYELLVRDSAVVVTAGPGCRSVDEHTVRCVGAPP